jgi:hypothetical protein
VAGELEGHYLRGPLLAVQGWALALAGEAEHAKAVFEQAAALAAPAPLQLVFVARVEILCWERLGDAAGLDSAAAHLEQVGGADSSPIVAWASFASALAAYLRGDHSTAAERARSSTALATAASEAPVAWRSHFVLGRAGEALPGGAAATAELRTAASILSPMIAELEPALRASFQARSDVALALASV